MALINKKNEIIRIVIQQSWRRLSRLGTCQVPAVILNAATVTKLFNHLQVKHGSLFQPLSLDQPVFFFKYGQLLLQLLLDCTHGNLEPFPGGYKVT